MVDPLSDVLRAVRLDGAHFFQVDAFGAWSVSALPAHELMPRILPAAEHLVSYHILVAGSCRAETAGAPPVTMEAGDVIVFPHGDAHLLTNAEGAAARHVRVETAPAHLTEVLRIGTGEALAATFVCGFLGWDARPFNPLLASLPRCLHVRGVTDGWLTHFPRQVVLESRHRRVGGASMLTRMAELMFAEVLRRHVEQRAPLQAGWLAGLRDPVVGPALTMLHDEPARPWTLASLARAVASSRTVLADRFAQLVGIPPMTYLTRWRLQLAAERLARCSVKVAAVGAQVGYQSEAAFSRAFKRETGRSPADWRRLHQQQDQPSAA